MTTSATANILRTEERGLSKPDPQQIADMIRGDAEITILEAMQRR